MVNRVTCYRSCRPLIVFGLTVGLLACRPLERTRVDAGERWTSLHSSRTIEADFVGMWGEQVVLQLSDRRVAVDVNDLVAESRILARRLAEEQQQNRNTMVSQIQAEADEAAAPAPTPLPRPESAPSYQPPTSGSLMDRIEWFNIENKNGHGLLAAFDALPPSYQGEIERLTRMSLAKLDTDQTMQAIGAVQSIGDLIVTRQRWVFSYPLLEALPPESSEPLESMLLDFAGLLRDGLDPAQLKLDELKTRPMRAWLVGFDQRIAPYVASLNSQMESLGANDPEYTVVEEGDGKATVEVSFGGATDSMEWVYIEGMWVPANMKQEEFTEGMKKWEESLQSVPDGSVLAGGEAAMVQAAIAQFTAPLREAETAREFHSQLDTLVNGVTPMISMGLQMAQANLGGPNRPGGMSGFGNSEYGQGYPGSGYEEQMMGMDEMEAYEQQMMQQMQMQQQRQRQNPSSR